MDINIFLVCYNESILLPHAIKHYKKYLPSCKITICDNKSTDNSVEIAKSFGCNIITWDTNNKIDDFLLKDLKNNCWKNIEKGWIIMADMDEFLCVTENELLKEYKLGTSILTIQGLNMIGESYYEDLSDIDLQEIEKYVIYDAESKNLCFLRENINDMNYNLGAHSCNPKGKIIYSKNTYINKHMAILGIKFLVNKMLRRYERSHDMRKQQIAVHYTNDIDKIIIDYLNSLNTCKYLS